MTNGKITVKKRGEGQGRERERERGWAGHQGHQSQRDRPTQKRPFKKLHDTQQTDFAT